MRNDWRNPEIVVTFTTGFLVVVLWPLYSWLRAVCWDWFQPHEYWWVLTAALFAVFVWLEMVLLGCKLLDLLVAMTALSMGMLSAAAIALTDSEANSFLHRIGFQHGVWFVLLPLLYLHIIVEVALVKRANLLLSQRAD